VEPINFESRKRLTQREVQAARRLAKIHALLDELEPESENDRFSSRADIQRWKPARGRRGAPMVLGLHDGDIYLPIVQSEADWDRVTVEREDVFLRRFGFDWPRRYRGALIRLKHERELSDREIKLLFRAGCLKRSTDDVRFEANRWLAATGWMLIACLSPTILLFVSGVATHVPTTLVRGLAVVGVAGWLLTMVWMGYAFYIEPWRIHERSLARLVVRTGP
jgi:hypothetical protein